MGEFRMPSLGADMDEGRVLEWHVQPGDRVVRGQIVAVVETDKADIDVEVFEAGVVEALLVPVGEKVAVGTPLALISAGGPAPGAPEPAAPVAPVLETPVLETPVLETPVLETPVLETPVLAAATARPPAAVAPLGAAVPTCAGTHSPVVRHLAERLGVDTAALRGSGPGGSVTRADVERAAGRRSRSSPRARRLAASHHVDLAGLRGTGVGGAVTGEDVLRAAAAVPEPAAPVAPAAPAAPARSAADKAAAMRAAIARLMERSAREVPHYHVDLDVDLAPTLAWLEGANEGRPAAARLLPAAALLRATALAATEVPGINGTWEDGRLVVPDAVHLGVAVSLRTGGLVTPVIRDAASCSLDELMAMLRDLVTRARSGRLRASELTGATITVTNLGELGADRVSGVIYPPQVALVGFGRVREQPWAEHGLLGVRPVVTATLAADHRASDGLVGSRFLLAVAAHLADPESL